MRIECDETGRSRVGCTDDGVTDINYIDEFLGRVGRVGRLDSHLTRTGRDAGGGDDASHGCADHRRATGNDDG